MERSILVIGTALAMVISGSLRADMMLGFSDCSTLITGSPGEVKTIHIFATLTSANLPAGKYQSCFGYPCNPTDPDVDVGPIA